jgi:hypothetical protein
MKKIVAVALVAMGLLITYCGCGYRRACCSCQSACPTTPSDAICCPMPPRTPACEEYVAEIPVRNRLRLVPTPAADAPALQDDGAPRIATRPQPEE